MNDDWRLRVDVHEEGRAQHLTDRLEASELEHDLSTSFGDRVIVSRDGPEVFCYAATRQQAEATERAISSLAAEHRWHLESELQHWHPVAEEWEAPDQPLPRTSDESAAERATLMAEEREESAEQGYPEYEVRVRCSSREDAVGLAQRLAHEGLPVVHRHEFVVLGATDEDAANALAARVRSEAPSGSSVTAEASVSEIAGEVPGATPFSPFAVFGGLGG